MYLVHINKKMFKKNLNPNSRSLTLDLNGSGGNFPFGNQCETILAGW